MVYYQSTCVLATDSFCGCLFEEIEGLEYKTQTIHSLLLGAWAHLGPLARAHLGPFEAELIWAHWARDLFGPGPFWGYRVVGDVLNMHKT